MGLNPKLKLLLVLLASLGALFLRDPAFMFLFFGVALLFTFLVADIREFLGWSKYILLVAAFAVVLQAFTYSGLGFSTQGTVYGLWTAARLLTLFLIVFSFIDTTPPKDLISIFDFLPRKLSLMFTLMFRLIPEVKDEAGRIKLAQMSRGVGFSLSSPLRSYFSVLIPVFRKTVQRSENLALSIESRGGVPS